VGPDAIGWCIDVLDIPGELAQYQFSAPPLDDPAIEWTASAADANMWHRVTVVGRPSDVGDGGDSSSSTGADVVGDEERRQGKYREEATRPGSGGSGGDSAGAAAAETSQQPRSPSSLFLVEFESGRTAS
ncbi:unnamed protein product, partial [Ectocarpus sp. 12 AP-2014]